MTVYRGRWGTWYVRFWHAKQLHEQGGFPTMRAAREAEAVQRAALHAPRRGQTGDAELRLTDYAARWLLAIAPDVAPATLASYRERLHGHVLPALGRLRLPEVTRAAIKGFLAEKRQAGYAKNGVRLMKAALSALLSDAVDDGLIPSNPALQLGRHRRARGDTLTAGERRQTIRPMTREQRDAVLEMARAHAPLYAPLLELLVKTGLRPSEAIALRAEDLDAAAGTLRVERAWVLGRMKSTKTTEGRTVDLTPRLVDLLRHQAARAPASGLLFPSAAGTPLDRHKLGVIFQRVAHLAAHGGSPGAAACRAAHRTCPEAGTWRFRLYDLKHTYASLRLAAGAPVTYVAAQLGHASPVTTLRHYARWMPAGGRQWVEEDGATRLRAKRAGSGSSKSQGD